jgi:hypothetical protein
MSTTYHRIAPPIVKPAPHGDVLRFGARAVALIAAGAIGGYMLRGVELPTTPVAQPIAATTIERVAMPATDASLGYFGLVDERPAAPAMDASLGFWDVVDTRPAITAAEAAAAIRESSEPWQASAWMRARGVEGGSADASNGYWDVAATQPAVSAGNVATIPFDEARPLAVAPPLAVEAALAAAEANAVGYETYDVIAGQSRPDASAIVPGPHSQWYGTAAAAGAYPLPKSYADMATIGREDEYAHGAVVGAPAKSYADLATIGSADEYVDGIAVGAPTKSYADLATVPGPTGVDEPLAEPGRLVVREGAQGYETVRVPAEEDLGPPAYVGSFWQFET